MGFIDQYRIPADLPHRLPVFPLPGALLLPRSELPLNIFEPRYLDMVNDALSGDRMIGMIQPIAGMENEIDLNSFSREDVYKAVYSAKITAYKPA